MGLDRRVLFHLATSERLERGVKRVPGAERAAWRAASRYVAGRSLSEALAVVEGLGHAASIDLFGGRASSDLARSFEPGAADGLLRQAGVADPITRQIHVAALGRAIRQASPS